MLIFNNTNNNTLAVVSKDTGKLQFQIPIPGESGFNRGLLQTSERHFWVGTHNPASIYEIDIEARKVINSVILGDEEESAYAICPLPNHFDTPNILL